MLRVHDGEADSPVRVGLVELDDVVGAEVLGGKVSREAGLADLRDWLVLVMAGDPAQRTQLEIATQLGIDKSTLVPILDRLERDGLIVRTFSERDRRVRIPRATPAGLAVASQVAITRDAAINDRLAAIPPSQRAAFHATLWSIVEGGAPPG